MEEKKGRGGQRVGAGRKPLGLEKKATITLYVPEKKIFPFGNKEKLKAGLYQFIDNGGIPKTTIQDLNAPTNEIKPQEQPKSNYFVNTTPQPVSRPKTVQEWISEKRAIEDPELFQEWFKRLETDSHLTSREKSLIKST